MPDVAIPRFSIEPTNAEEVPAVKHAAKILRYKLKDLVLAAMWRGLREIIMDRDQIEVPPLDTKAMLRALSVADLREVVREAEEKTPLLRPPESPAPDPRKQGRLYRSKGQKGPGKRFDGPHTDAEKRGESV